MAEVKCAFDEMVPLGNLAPNPDNPNKDSEKQIRLSAKSISRVRIQPSIRACPVLREKMPVNDDDFTLLKMKFQTMSLTLVGAGSPANLASRPVRYLFCDEVDK